MRNIVEYPITRKEVIRCLEIIRENIVRENEIILRYGDMRPLLLEEALRILREAP